MCGLKAAQIYGRPFRAAKDHVQPLAAQKILFTYRQKVSDFPLFIIHGIPLNRKIQSML